jgi:predicted GTPase
VNYQSLIDNTEFKILDNIGKIPVILVINKVDLMQEMERHDDNIIRNFDKQIPICLENCAKLKNIRERLLKFQKKIVILSLREEEDGDQVIGVNNLIEVTNEYLLKKNLINNSQNSFDYDEAQGKRKELYNIETKRDPIRILLIGYTSTGKSSLINFFGRNNVAKVGLNGLPVTQNIEEYLLPKLNMILIDTMGLEKKQDNTEKLQRLREYCRPDFIWLLLNYQSSIEQDEFDIIHKLYPCIPTIVVVNFMDNLQMYDHDIDYETDTQLNNEYYRSLQQRLSQFKRSQNNVRHIVAISLRSEELDDRPRGLELLYQKTIKTFEQTHTHHFK